MTPSPALTLAADLRYYVTRVGLASTREHLADIYCGMSGCEADEDAELKDLRDLALDYMREVCYANGTHVSEIGL